jgi:NAD(P)-dependent dehydrogenase (short-subunit alcohol dehydrogenase family)
MSATANDACYLVTGAASGIGQATAWTLMAAGHRVIGVDLDSTGLQQTADRADTLPGTFEQHQADVADDDACRNVMAAVARLGSLRVIINCAGVMPDQDTVQTLSVADWDRTFAINVRAIFQLTRHGLALMRPDGGVIVNVSSVHAFATQPGCTAYAATKGAIVALTHQLALELAPEGVRVVGVAPGSVDTPMSARAVQRSGAASLTELGFSDSPHAAGRIGSAQEVAEVISWLTSEAAAFVNGTTVRVDGALLAAIPSAPAKPTSSTTVPRREGVA